MRIHLLNLWTFFDPLYFRCTRLTYLQEKKNILRIRLTTYKGRPVTLADGTRIHRKDTLIKVHLHNCRLLQELNALEHELKKVRYLYRSVQESLPELVSYIQSHPQRDKIKGIVGITALNKSCERLGFEVHAISNPFYKWFKVFAHLPIHLISMPQPTLSSIAKHEPTYLFMSTETLFDKYKNEKAKST
ncbi:hypothetical protein LC040_08495 [Bacillus tianshenii]|nr:hypothetical protein LC040_08495 [Bacillus tianshenii]